MPYPMIIKNGMINAPIPGSSLTKEPGKHPWEKPPTYTDPHEAAQYIWDSMMKIEAFVHVISALEDGAPASGLTDSILMQGVMHGKFTLDVAILLQDAVFTMLATMGAKAGIKVKLRAHDVKPGQKAVERAIQQKRKRTKDTRTPDLTKPEAEEMISEMQPEQQGFMNKIDQTAPQGELSNG